ncbi:MAG TPA: excisionase family DNA-binding protein [Candidatus Omnitrophota bacterium]|nr:excisionase family DNA-binding protein [Candidatus Omnitrophota bacterium]HPB68138.1 excisionase family DNA-binding protein [Candidatus Omnitrophota bacterium]HQO58009.1 excisionase family DNA-binding protein [Candidatus Omnitrophota bacterium]
MKEKPFFSIAEVAKILGYSRAAIYKKVIQGQIEAIRVGRSFAISDETIKKLIKTVKGAPLEDEEKKEIDKVVSRTIKEYGETLKRLGSE